MSKANNKKVVITKPIPTSLTESAKPKINTSPVNAVTTYEKRNNKK
ncbi:hypothetical protein [Parabacteroides goldsteinii]|nr:hypothetical protein [Parabacteroides goldsteinii]